MDITLIKNAPIFMGFTDAEQELLAASFIAGQQQNGATLFKSGDQSEALYLLSEGFARLESESGQNLATLGTGSALGEVSLFRNSLQEVSAVAVSDVKFWRLPDQKLREIILQQPSIGLKLSKNFGTMIAQMQDYLVARLGQTVELSDLPQNTLRALASQLRSQEIPAGQNLYSSGSAPSGFFLLEGGLLELKPATSSGEAMQGVSPGAIVGALSLLTNKPYTEDAIAREDSMVWALSVNEFQTLNTQHRGLRRSLARTVRARLSKTDQEKAASRMAEMPIFAELAPDTMQAITQKMILQHISAGERVYRIGEGGESLYLIEDGEIELTAENASGVIEELARIGNGSYFGEMSLFTGQIRTEDATATRNTNLWVLFKADLDELATKHPDIGSALSQGLATRLAAEEMEDGRRFGDFALFSTLRDDELGLVARHLKPTRYRKGEQIFRISTPADSLYLIENGEVRVQTFNGGSWLLGPGDSIGEKAILTNQPHNGSVMAETDVDLWALDRSSFDTLAAEQPSLIAHLRETVNQQHLVGSAPTSQLPMSQPMGARNHAAERTAPPLAAGYADGTASQGAGHNAGYIAGQSVDQSADQTTVQNEDRFAPQSDAAPNYQPNDFQQRAPARTPLRPGAAQQVRTARRADSEFAPRPAAAGAPYAPQDNSDSSYYNQYDADVASEQSPNTAGQMIAPPAGGPSLARQRRAGVAANPLGADEPRRRRMGFGEWFGGLSAFAKLWIALLTLLLIYVIGIAAPLTLWNMVFGNNASSQLIVPISASSSLAAVYSRGSYEVMAYDSEAAKEIALADQQVAPTPTYTPFPTPTSVSIALALSNNQAIDAAPASNLQILRKTSGSTQPRFIKQVEQAPKAVAVIQQPTPLPPPPPTPVPTATHTVEQAAYYAAIARGENPNAPKIQVASIAMAQPQPEAAPVQAAAAAPRVWDSRLDQLGVRVEEANVAPGQEYWHLKEVIWWDEEESRGKHHAFVEVLDLDGSRIVGHSVKVKWGDGEHIGQTEDKAFPDYAFNYQLYAANRAYDITVEGLPSDKLVGAGLGDIQNPFHRIHVSYLLTYQKRIK